MIDLYTNVGSNTSITDNHHDNKNNVQYDCDTQCTNLYERLCECLYRNSLPQEKKPLTSINTLAFQGLLAVCLSYFLTYLSTFVDVSDEQILHSIAQRCKAKAVEGNENQHDRYGRRRKDMIDMIDNMFTNTIR